MPKVLSKRTDTIPLDAVYVGRPSKWGNPYKIGWQKHNIYWNRDDVILMYKKMIAEGFSATQLAELKGKDLVCWCSPLPCHADVLLELANESTQEAKK